MPSDIISSARQLKNRGEMPSLDYTANKNIACLKLAQSEAESAMQMYDESMTPNIKNR